MNFASMENFWHVAEHAVAVAVPFGAGVAWIVRQVKASQAARVKEMQEERTAVMQAIAVMRENDLKHIDDKMDGMAATCDRTETAIGRLDGKVDGVDKRINEHVQWHLDHS